MAHKRYLMFDMELINNISGMKPARAMTTKNFISRVSVDLVPPLTSCNFLRDSQAPCPLVLCLPWPSSQLGAIQENTCLLDHPSSILSYLRADQTSSFSTFLSKKRKLNKFSSWISMPQNDCNKVTNKIFRLYSPFPRCDKT